MTIKKKNHTGGGVNLGNKEAHSQKNKKKTVEIENGVEGLLLGSVSSLRVTGGKMWD